MKLSMVFLAASCLVTRGWSDGTLIFGHFGAADPTTEGFALASSGNPSLAPVTNDMGFDAWHIGLDTSDDIGQYTRNLTSEEQADIEAGWILSWTLRVAQPFGTPTVGIFVQLHTGAEAIPLFDFGAQSDGDPILRVGNTEYVLEDGGPGYHSYQLMYDAALGRSSLWADGTLLAADITGLPRQTAWLAWGGGQHPPGSAYANWNEVSLWAIPEPSTVSLLLLGGGVAICLGSRRR